MGTNSYERIITDTVQFTCAPALPSSCETLTARYPIHGLSCNVKFLRAVQRGAGSERGLDIRRNAGKIHFDIYLISLMDVQHG